MILNGSCHCESVRFSVRSHTPHPFNRCYCAICRKTAGGGGYAINLAGAADSLTVTGKRHVRIYRASADKVDGGVEDDGLSYLRRHFCHRCASVLWCWDPRWPDLVHPAASAIDTPLPRPPEVVHLMTASAPGWVEIPRGSRHTHFPGYPEEGIEDWHRARGLLVE